MPIWIEQFLTLLSLPEYSLTTVFVVSFISATLIPLGSEPVVYGVIHLRPDMFWPVVLVATAGWIVIVGLKLSNAAVTVLVLVVDVIISVEVTVALTTGVIAVCTVTVGINVVVACGPTMSEKSRWYAIGHASPLFEITISDHSPLESWFLSSGHVTVSGVSSGVKGVSVHEY